VTRPGTRLPLLLVSFVSLVFALALCEFALRAFHTIHHWGDSPRSERPLHQASSIPGLDYEMAPNRELLIDGRPVKTNQWGMRDTEPSAQETDSHCRIAVLGDSYTWGLGVRAEETYPKLLEKLLRESPAGAECPFEVLNFGVIGYSSYDEALMLRYRAVYFDPQVVVVGYVLNDPEVDPVQPLHAYFVKHVWWQPYGLLHLIRQVETLRDEKRLGGGDYYIYLHAQPRKWQSVVDAFTDIRDVTSARNIKVLVVIFPELTAPFKGKPWSAYPYMKIHQQVSDLAVRNGFRVVDLRDAFSECPSQDVVFPGGDDHPNVLGHEVAARAIEKELLAESSYFFGLRAQ
jgi:GDSL-like Lipase/Acylhydrolase family